MRIVRPFRSFSVARGCARVDSTLDTAKLCSDRRIDVDRPWLRAVLGEEKRFYTVWTQTGHTRPTKQKAHATDGGCNGISPRPSSSAILYRNFCQL